MPKDFKADGPLAGYRPLPGVADELMDPSGAVRRAWWGFIDHFAKLAPDEIAARFAKGDQYLYDAGVFYRQYGEPGGSAERDWPLSHIPVLIHESEWQGIAAGLIQRADLLEEVVADLYGENRLVADGHLPASLIGMSDEWLRPLVGVAPRGGHHLNFIAFEIGRGPDGNWWVLGDRTQAPSGAGFALENRVATARVFSDLYPEANVHRLAGFFQTFRDSLRGLRAETDSQVAILTPGLFSETYFEHAYIARYLGFMLLEGEDLAIEHGKVWVRTVEGLAPVSVLWRRLDAAFADPLELNDHSRLGAPGLVEAVRQGNVTMVNTLGAGVLETRALLAFMPRISQALRGTPLALPNIATWWCGQSAEREHVRANADRMVIGPALSTRLPFEPDETATQWKASHSHAAENIGKLLDTEGALLVGQEAVTLSTTPAYVDGRLVPRPMSLRVFLARTPNGWQVMPGGYARIGRTQDAAAIAMQAGGSAADVWIVSDEPVETHTMLPPRSASFQRAAPSVLPSRAADNLYWLGRYIERGEHGMRLLRAYHLRIAEAVAPTAPLLEDLHEHLDSYGIDPAKAIPDRLTSTLGSAIRSASQVRDRFSVDGWMALNDLDKTARSLAQRVQVGDDAARAMRVLLRKINGFSGLVHENMYHSMGWRFLTIGRSLERAMATASMLASFAAPEAPEGALDLAVEVADSSMTHRSRYAVATNRNTVIDLLVFDSMNPRAVLYHLTELREQVNHLPGALVHRQMSALARGALQAHASLAVKTPETLDSQALLDLRGELAALSELLSSTYMK